MLLSNNHPILILPTFSNILAICFTKQAVFLFKIKEVAVQKSSMTRKTSTLNL